MAVDPLVVGEDDRGDLLHALDAADELGSVGGVVTDEPEVLLAEGAVGEQDPVREGELPEVVQEPGGVHGAQLLVGAAGGDRDRVRVAGHGRRVARGELVAHRQRSDHRDQHADLHRRELEGPLLELIALALGAQQLGEQHVEGGQQAEREQQ